MNITNNSVQSVLGDGEVLSWAELRSQAGIKNGLTSKLSQDGDTERDPGELEEVAEDMEVSCSKDENDDRCVCKTRSSWVIPGQECGEERVVVCKGLSGGSISAGRSSGGS